MLQVLVTYDCGNKENRDAFYAALKENDISAISEAEEGCICYRYYYPCEDDSKVFLVEQWETVAAQQAHKLLPHFALIGQLKEKYQIASTFAFTEVTAVE